MQFQVLRKLKYRKNAIEPAANDDPNPEPYLVRTYILVYGVEQRIETIIIIMLGHTRIQVFGRKKRLHK